MKPKKRIGIFDSGVGGLTVLAELHALMPQADYVFIGDSANNPYGNRSPQNLEYLAKNMIRFLLRQKVDVMVIACNTLSVTLHRYCDSFAATFIPITVPIIGEIAAMSLEHIGLLGTVATVNSGVYQRNIQAANPAIEVIGEGCPLLAGRIDAGRLDAETINAEIRKHMDNLLRQQADLRHVILGCTHYPLVMDNFRKLYPDIVFIDPARNQAMATREYLSTGKFRETGQGSLTICSTGKTKIFEFFLRRLGIWPVDELLQVTLS